MVGLFYATINNTPMQIIIAIITGAALAAVINLPTAGATPTKCEFIAVELFESVDRGDMTEEEALGILDRCHQLDFE